MLCGASAYEQKYYFNKDFDSLPDHVKKEADGFYDDIGGALKIKKLRVEKEELLESLEMYYRVFFLGEDVDKEKTEE